MDTAAGQVESFNCYFSGPMWSWKETTIGLILGDLTNKVTLVMGDGKHVRQTHTRVEIPTPFFKLYNDILRDGDYVDHGGRHTEAGYFCVKQADDRFYFFLRYHDTDVPLWYWTNSNLPKWVRIRKFGHHKKG